MPVSMLTSSGWADVLHVRERAVGVAAINRVAGLSFRSAVWLGRARTPRAIFKLARPRFFFGVGDGLLGLMPYQMRGTALRSVVTAA